MEFDGARIDLDKITAPDACAALRTLFAETRLKPAEIVKLAQDTRRYAVGCDLKTNLEVELTPALVDQLAAGKPHGMPIVTIRALIGAIGKTLGQLPGVSV